MKQVRTDQKAKIYIKANTPTFAEFGPYILGKVCVVEIRKVREENMEFYNNEEFAEVLWLESFEEHYKIPVSDIARIVYL